MSKLYKTPDVFVNEISTAIPVISSVETAIPAFIGYTQKARKLQVGDLHQVPTRISSMQEYELYFGARVYETVSVIVEDLLVKTGDNTTFNSRRLITKIPYLRNYMHYNLQLYFSNGGGPCYVVSVGKPKLTLTKKELRNGLEEVYRLADPTLIAFPDGINLNRAGDLYSLYEEALIQCYELRDRFVLMDISLHDLQGKKPIDFFRESVSVEKSPAALKFGAAYYPMLNADIPLYYTDSSVRLIHQTIIREKGRQDIKGKGEFDSLFLNNPRLMGTTLYSQVKTDLSNHTVSLPPSSALAGVFCAQDKNRGVWKAPANIALASVKGPSYLVNDTEQEYLNRDPLTGKSINAIRLFTGRGTMVWGARTLAGNDNEWRYISVCRFYAMVEKSIGKSLESFVFEPNDANTWTRVRAMIENFMLIQYRQGALMGAKAEQAFFVRAGLGQTMTENDIREGRMNIEIGMAPLRPAEFVILRFSINMQAS